MYKHIVFVLVFFTVCAYAKDIAITASGIGVDKIDACQTAKKNLDLQAIGGRVTSIGSCDCEKNVLGQWNCAVDGAAQVK